VKLNDPVRWTTGQESSTHSKKKFARHQKFKSKTFTRIELKKRPERNILIHGPPFFFFIKNVFSITIASFSVI
jgi:hypothetical protein